MRTRCDRRAPRAGLRRRCSCAAIVLSAYTGSPVETPSPRRWPGVKRQWPSCRPRTFPDVSTIGPSAALHAAPLEERAVVVAAEEARLLALRPPRRRQPRPRGLGPRLVLRLLSEREPDPLEQGRVEPREHVRLVLVRVGRPRQQQPALVLHRTSVVPRREPDGAGAPCEREQLVEPERAVAPGARIRRLAALVAADERIDDRPPELVAQVERHVRKTEAVACLPGRSNGVGRAAGALGVAAPRDRPTGAGSRRRRRRPARSSATALSTPPLIATATREELGAARNTGPSAAASASTTSSSPSTAAASSIVSPARSSESPSASASTMRSPRTRSRTAAQSPLREASPKTSCMSSG